MSQRMFHVKAVWEEEAGVFICESDIIGLHIEAESLDEFEELVQHFAPELIVANHIAPTKVKWKDLADVIPTILLERPSTPAEGVTA